MMELEEYVGKILKEIEEDGIDAVKRYSKKFDDYEGRLRLKQDEFEEFDIPEEDKEAIDRVIKRVERNHKKQKRIDNLYQKNGSLYGLIYRPLERVGLYVPGGRSLPSSLIMCGVPAKIAGVEEIVVTTPPTDGKIDPYVLYTARSLGFTEIYKLGGIQAIASMGYGIGMEKVDKIFGPGNKFVNEAKRQLFGTVGIDGLAGPSEICIIAYKTAEEEQVISDLKAQVEHGDSSKAWLLTTSDQLAYEVEMEQVEVISEDSLKGCVERANQLAPEHLQILTKDPLALVDDIRNAGAVYLGEYTPAAAADYFLGVNHVLPTGTSARYGSVLTVDDFMKPISFACASRDDYMDDLDSGVRLAEIEKMEEHKRSLEARE